MWGSDDRLIAVETAAEFDADPVGSTLIVYASVGHVAMEEILEKTAAVAAEFLASLQKRREDSDAR